MKKHNFCKKLNTFLLVFAFFVLFLSLFCSVFSQNIPPALWGAFLSAVLFALCAILSEREKRKSEDFYKKFISGAFHDLRSPITSISGFAQGILDGTLPEDSRKKYISVIKGESDRLSRLISSLLDASRLDRGTEELVLSDFDLSELLRTELFLFEKKINEKKLQVELSVEDGLYVHSDRDAVLRVITNLYHNAVKFSAPGGVLRVSASQVDDKTEVTVYNTGRGIKKEELSRIFQPFYKGEEGDTGEKNSGLGLYISSKLLEALGESIVADSREGEYCAFTFTLKNSKKGKEV